MGNEDASTTLNRVVRVDVSWHAMRTVNSALGILELPHVLDGFG